jgi:hypothetical protein
LVERTRLIGFQHQGFAKVGDRFVRSIEAVAEQSRASHELIRTRGCRLGPRELCVQQVEKDFAARNVCGLLLQGFGDLERVIERVDLLGIDLQDALKVRESLVSSLAHFAEQLCELDSNGDFVAAREM